MAINGINSPSPQFGHQVGKSGQKSTVKFGLLDGGIVSGPCAIGCGVGCLGIVAMLALPLILLKKAAGVVKKVAS